MITRRYNYSTRWKFTHLLSSWKLILVRICFLRFISAWKSSGNRGITVGDIYNSCHVWQFYSHRDFFPVMHNVRFNGTASNIVAHVLSPGTHNSYNSQFETDKEINGAMLFTLFAEQFIKEDYFSIKPLNHEIKIFKVLNSGNNSFHF